MDWTVDWAMDWTVDWAMDWTMDWIMDSLLESISMNAGLPNEQGSAITVGMDICAAFSKTSSCSLPAKLVGKELHHNAL